jgi:fructose-specific phosphotransferase system IIC component
MSPLLKNIVKGAAAVAGAFLVYTGVKKVAPTALPVDPFAGNTTKTWLYLAGFVAVGAAVVALIGKFAKIPFLRN